MSRWRGNGGIIGASTARDYASTSNDSDGVWGLEQKYNLKTYYLQDQLYLRPLAILVLLYQQE